MTLRSDVTARALGIGVCLCISAVLGGCGASIPNLTTGSLFGGSSAAPAAAPQVSNDPTSRAIQVGTTSARAQKCGFNFDAVKLRTQFLATESATNPADAAKLGQVYDIAFNGVSKAVVAQSEDYCTPHKTATIKEALNRHLTGDYTPATPEPVADDGGLFGDLGTSDSSGYHDSNPMKRNE